MSQLSSCTFVMQDKEKARFSPLMHSLRLCTLVRHFFFFQSLKYISQFSKRSIVLFLGPWVHEPKSEEFLPVMFFPQVSTWLILSLYFGSPSKCQLHRRDFLTALSETVASFTGCLLPSTLCILLFLSCLLPCQNVSFLRQCYNLSCLVLYPSKQKSIQHIVRPEYIHVEYT